MQLNRSYYSDYIDSFLSKNDEEIIGTILKSSRKTEESAQVQAWLEEIKILKPILFGYQGHVFFEFEIPRMGKRIDVVLIIQNVIFLLEFKIGKSTYKKDDVEQVWDYALDLSNFHETSHNVCIAPILIASQAKDQKKELSLLFRNNILEPIITNAVQLDATIKNILNNTEGSPIESDKWMSGRYEPTPTIIEAALALYNQHDVTDITRTEASGASLSYTTEKVKAIITNAKKNSEKVICFVTGVPGAGKTLVGLEIATKQQHQTNNKGSVFLSGNGPLVAVLRESLARDKYRRSKNSKKEATTLGKARSEVKTFIQNVHHFRDEYLKDPNPPFDHVTIFDEAQRAWDKAQTVDFMKRKKGHSNFEYSEPEFLISCLDRHRDWAVIVCLVGGGQEINKGEAGIKEWIESINRSFQNWKIHISPQLSDKEYACDDALAISKTNEKLFFEKQLHLSVSMRSFRAERLSAFVKNILDIELDKAKADLASIIGKYPIALTRDLSKAKAWIRAKARGSERFGMLVSSKASRLKPLAIDIRPSINPIHWFLEGKDDVRSSFFFEEVATEFHVQGLELDWTCVTWDADFRFDNFKWNHFEFKGNKWQNIGKEARQKYLKNAYRVLLTRARQGMVIVVPEGTEHDITRKKSFYNETFEYLREVGIPVLP